MSRSRVAIAATAAMLLALPATAKEDYVYGPEPDWAQYNSLGEAALRAQLPDPDNWTVSWPWGYMQARWWHKGKTPGWLTCGIMTARTPPVKGQSSVMFVAVIDYDQVRQIDISQNYSNSLVNVACADFAAQGKLPPASLRPAASELQIARLGMTIRAMPEGAYVVGASAGSLAERSGLTPGTVITRVNGVALSGLSHTMASVLGADAATLQLETATGATITLRPPK